MGLDPQLQKFISDLQAEGAADFTKLSVDEARASMKDIAAHFPSSQEIAFCEDRAIEEGRVSARIYTPHGDGPFPVLVYIHGGGWVVGDLDSYDPICRELCGMVGCIVVSLNYRLAPEHRFPAAVEDVILGLRHTFLHCQEWGGDPNRIGIAGDSAGANLAAVASLEARSWNYRPCAQLLIYPATSHFSTPTQSMIDNGERYMLTQREIVWFTEHYLGPGHDGQDLRFNLSKVTDLSGLPSTFVITAEYDPLRDEGEAFAEALRASGVSVELKRYDGAIHGFFSFFSAFDISRRAANDASKWLKRQLFKFK